MSGGVLGEEKKSHLWTTASPHPQETLSEGCPTDCHQPPQLERPLLCKTSLNSILVFRQLALLLGFIHTHKTMRITPGLFCLMLPEPQSSFSFSLSTYSGTGSNLLLSRKGETKACLSAQPRWRSGFTSKPSKAVIFEDYENDPTSLSEPLFPSLDTPSQSSVLCGRKVL